MLAPRIAAEDPQVAGIIIMAGTARPLEKVVVEQVKYIAGLTGTQTPEDKKQIENAEAIAAQVESPSLKPDTVVDFFGAPIPGSYFLDLRNYDPGKVAAGLKVPILVLQGGTGLSGHQRRLRNLEERAGERSARDLQVLSGLHPPVHARSWFRSGQPGGLFGRRAMSRKT